MHNEHLVVSLKKPIEEVAPRPPVRSRRKRSRMWALYVAVLALAFLVLGGVYWNKTRVQSDQSSETEVQAVEATQDAEKEVGELIAEVGKLILLPTDEVPTVATVSDPSKLADQPFFKNAKVGDKVLIYTKSSKAYLYDPVARRLVEVAPITTDAQ